MADLQRKIYNKLKRPALAALATVTRDGRPWARYVMVQADPDLTIFIATFKGSRKVRQVRRQRDVHLLCGVTDYRRATSYLQIEGRAKVVTDPKVKRARWSDNLKAYFKSPDDPNYVVLVVEPRCIEFQDMQSMQPQVWQAPGTGAEKKSAKKGAKKSAKKQTGKTGKK